MFISPPSLSLSPTVFASGTISGNPRPYPFPDLLPLSTSLTPPPNQSSPSSLSYFSPGCESPPPAFPPSMPPPDPNRLSPRDDIDSSSQSSASVPATPASPGPSTDPSTSVGMNLPSPSNFGSNSDAFASSRFTLSRTDFASRSMSSPFFSDSPSMSGITSTTPTLLPTHSSSYSSTSKPILSPPSSTSSTPPLTSPTSTSSNATSNAVSTILVFSTVVTSVSAPLSSALNSSSVSSYAITTVFLGQGATTTDFITTSQALSTESSGSAVNSIVPLSPGTIAAIALGIVGAFAFSALWLFCARRRQRELLRETAVVPPENHASGPLDDEIPDLSGVGYGTNGTGTFTTQTGTVMEERYAGILAALHSTERFGGGNGGGSTGGVYGSRHDTATGATIDDDVAGLSSPTLPLPALPPDDPPYTVSLSPPPPASHQATPSAPPPSSYILASRRKSSPGPDAVTWLGGYSIAPSSNSHNDRSQTLGSGSGSGSADALSRTRTGSEEPLLGIGKTTPEVSAGAATPVGVSPVTAADPGGNRLDLGSAFGSPPGSMYSPSTLYPLPYDSSGSHGTRTVSGSGSYGYPHSGTPSSFDVLRSVSSQGALSTAYSHGQGQGGFKFGFSKPGSSSSGGSLGRKGGSARHSFGVPPTSFKSWKDPSDKDRPSDKPSVQDKDRKPRPRSWTSASASGSVDEKQGRASPVAGVRAFLGRLRRGGQSPSPPSSDRDLSSPTHASVDAETEKATANRLTPPPIQIEAATPHRRQFSFILSNPDPNPPSPYSGVGDVTLARETPPSQTQELRSIQDDVPMGDPEGPGPVPFSPGGLLPAMPFPTRYVLGAAPSPAPTEESRLVEGLLHPRLRTQGQSDASLRDFEDYSRPIGGVVKNRLYSTTTFGTMDDASTNRGTPVQDVAPSDSHGHGSEVGDVFGSLPLAGVRQDSLVVDDVPSPMTRAAQHSPVGPSAMTT